MESHRAFRIMNIDRSKTQRFSSASRKGMALVILVSMLAILTVSAVHFFVFSRELRSTGLKVRNQEILRQAAESALDEAFRVVQVKLAVSPDELLPWLQDFKSEETKVFEPETLMMTNEIIKEMDPSPNTVQVRVTLRHFRKCLESSLKKPYYPGEGIGTIEMSAVAELSGSGKKVIDSCSIIRQHDFKVASIISSKDRVQKGSYVQNPVLDYALFVRKGPDDFNKIVSKDERKGSSINPENGARFWVENDNSKPGKVFFGKFSPDTGAGQGKGPDAVWLNISKKWKDILPTFPDGTRQKKVTMTPDHIKKVFSFMPNIDKGVQYLEGTFVIFIAPVPDRGDPPANSEYSEYAPEMIPLSDLLNEGPGGRVATGPGIEILGEAPESKSLTPAFLEGDIRQRFFYAVFFRLKFNKDPDNPEVQKLNNSIFHCFSSDLLDSSADSNTRNFIEGLNKYEREISQGEGGGYPLLSSFQFGVPYKGGEKLSPFNSNDLPLSFKPVFPSFVTRENNTTGSLKPGFISGFRPFANTNMWTSWGLVQEDFQDLGVYDPEKGFLNLHHYHCFSGPGPDKIHLLKLDSKTGDLVIRGRGVLIADGIEIDCGIRKNSPTDFCVLVARKAPIKINTTKQINAFLVSLTSKVDGKDSQNPYFGTVQVSSGCKLDLVGGMAVDEIDFNGWPSDKHRVKYDPVFFGDSDKFAGFVSRPVTFFRMLGSQE